MGCALARAAMLRGAEVTLIHGHMDVQAPMFVNACPVDSAAQMAEAVLKAAPQQDIIIKAAAVSDYTPATTAQNKIKRPMETCRYRSGAPLISSRPSERRNSRARSSAAFPWNRKPAGKFPEKLAAKNCDMICANSLTSGGAGFGSETNIITMITQNGEEALEK